MAQTVAAVEPARGREQEWDGEEQEGDEDMQLALHEWLEEFNQESDYETDEDEDDIGQQRQQSKDSQTPLKLNVPLSQSMEWDTQDQLEHLPPFDMDINWHYGGHISSVDDYHRTEIHSNHASSTSSSSSYSQSLLPTFPPENYNPTEIICSQFEISHMILLMLNGCTSDIFRLSSEDPNPSFSLTPTARRLRIQDVTSSTLSNILIWFLDFGNFVQVVRNQLFNLTSSLNYMEEIKERDEPYSAFLIQILGPVKSSLRDIFSSFHSLLLKLESSLPNPALEMNEIISGHLTLLQLYFKIKPWKEMFQTILFGITQTLTKMCEVDIKNPELLKYFPLLRAEDIMSHETQDFIHHIHVNSIITQLLNGLSNAHLISSHISTISSNSSLFSLGNEVADNNLDPLIPQSVLTFQSICLSCFHSLAGEYLKSFFNWIFQSDRSLTSSKSHNNYYTNLTYFGGLAYDHSISALPSKQSHLVTTTQQLIAKFNTFPPLWQPILAYGTMTKINIQVIIKHGIQRSKRYALMREFVSATEKVNLAFHTLLQRSGIQIILPLANLFSEMVNNDSKESLTTTLLPSSNSSSNLKLFLSTPLLTTDDQTSHESSSSFSSVMEIPQTIFDVTDIFPSVIHLLNEFCLEPLLDTLFISQQYAIHAFIGAPPSSDKTLQHQSFDLLTHLEFQRMIFFLGDPLLYDPLFDYLHLAHPQSYHSKHHSKRPYQHITEDLFSSIEQNIHNNLPENVTKNHLMVTEKTTDSTFSSSSYQSSPSLDKATTLTHILNSLTIEIHYTLPLSDFFTPDILTIYNNALRFLLKVQSCIWSGELIWKEIISSSSSAVLQEGYTLGSRISQETIVTPTSYITYHEIIRHAIQGLQVLLYYLKSLKSFYLNEIHVLYWNDMMASLFPSRRTSQSLHGPSGFSFPTYSSWTSVEDIFISHHHYLIKVQTLLSFLRPNIEEIISRGFKAMTNFEELNSLLATEQQVSQFSEDPHLPSQSKKLLESKFHLVLKEFNGMMKEIHQFKKIILEISSSPAAACSYLPSLASSSDSLPDSVRAEVLYYHYGTSLKMLIGL